MVYQRQPQKAICWLDSGSFAAACRAEILEYPKYFYDSSTTICSKIPRGQPNIPFPAAAGLPELCVYGVLAVFGVEKRLRQFLFRSCRSFFVARLLWGCPPAPIDCPDRAPAKTDRIADMHQYFSE